MDLGKPLRSIVHPLRADLPIYMGAEGPKNVALCGEIADGWLPIYYSPKVGGMYRAWLDEGLARRTTPVDFEIATNCQVLVTDDIESGVAAMKPTLAFYIGGMGAKDMNFHKDVFARMGYEKEVQEIQDLFFEGKRDQAIAAVPDSLVTDISLIGPVARIRDSLPEWEEAGVTTLVIGARGVDELRTVADAVLG
jgi:F420-dependent oxidoreductase-like protein